MILSSAGSLLGIYLAISICVVIYDLVVILSEKPKKRMMIKRKRSLYMQLNMQAALIYEGKTISERGQNQLKRQLRRVEDLLLFSDFVERYVDEKNPYFLEYLKRSIGMFQDLTRYYQKKSAMYRATYAWALSRLGMEIPGTQSFLLDCIMEKSIYCRENALTALYRNGNLSAIVEAFKRMSVNQIYHSEKLICDGLLSCPVDKQSLCAVLWDHLLDFDSTIQLAIIDVMRMSGEDYSEELMVLLKKESTDDELAYAIIRYFGKIRHPQAQQVMIDFLRRPRRDQWEYAAISASSLRSYRNETVVLALLQALKSRNWYVRYNAAESLVAMDLPSATFDSIFNGNDRYAKEILRYMANYSKFSQMRKTVGKPLGKSEHEPDEVCQTVTTNASYRYEGYRYHKSRSIRRLG